VDIVRQGDPIALVGTGWYPFEMFGADSFRWVDNDAQMNVASLRSSPIKVSITLEPGPGVSLKPFELKVFNAASQLVAELKVAGKERLHFGLPAGEPTVHQLRLHVEGGGKSAVGDERILNFRVFKISVESTGGDIVRTGVGLTVGKGWYPLENFNGELFRWAGNESVVESRDPEKAGILELEIEPGPGVGYKPFVLTVLGEKNEKIAEIEVKTRQHFAIPLPNLPSDKLYFKVAGGGKPTPGDARILNFRAFARID
jgi:hypothetical protein